MLTGCAGASCASLPSCCILAGCELPAVSLMTPHPLFTLTLCPAATATRACLCCCGCTSMCTSAWLPHAPARCRCGQGGSGRGQGACLLCPTLCLLQPGGWQGCGQDSTDRPPHFPLDVCCQPACFHQEPAPRQAMCHLSLSPERRHTLSPQLLQTHSPSPPASPHPKQKASHVSFSTLGGDTQPVPDWTDAAGAVHTQVRIGSVGAGVSGR